MARSLEGLERRRERDRRRAKAKNAAYYAANKERERVRCQAYHAGNRETRLAAKADWREANRDSQNAKARDKRRRDPDAARQYAKEWRLNPKRQEYERRWRELNADRERERQRLWAQNNSGLMRAKVAARRARKHLATPAWADAAAISAIYEECARLSAETGIPHEVDHFVPLKGETVCGLHVHQNLRIVSQSQNRKKHTKLELGCEDFWASDHASASGAAEGT